MLLYENTMLNRYGALISAGLNFRLQLETNEFVFSASALPIVDVPHLSISLSLSHTLLPFFALQVVK
jgi:hypothetical protein